MKKAIRFSILVVLVLLLALSCDNNASTGNNTGDASTSLFEEKTIESIGKATLDGNKTFTLEGDYKVGDGVLIKKNSRAVNNTTEGDKYYKTDSGYFLVVAQKDGSIAFEPSAMGLEEGESISIGKFNNSNDFKITVKEHKANSKHNIVEEFYYLDFTSPEFSSLNKQDVVVRLTSLNFGGKFSIITSNNVLTNNEGSKDYSEESGIGIIHVWSSEADEDVPPHRIHVVNPIDIKKGDSDIKLSSLFSILRVKASSLDEEKEYCISISGLGEETVSKIAETRYFKKTLLRNRRGEDIGIAIPYYFPEKDGGTIVYYVGHPETDALLDIDLEDFYTSLTSVDCTVSLIEKPDYVTSYNDLTDVTSDSNSAVDLQAAYDSSAGSFLTVSLRASKEKNIKIKTEKDIKGYSNGYYYYSGVSTGSGDFGLPTNKKKVNLNSICYAVVKLSKDVEEGQKIATVSEVEIKKVEMGTYTFRSDIEYPQYVSESDNQVRYSGNVFLSNNEGADFRKGKFMLDNSSIPLSIVDGDLLYNGETFSHTSYRDDGTEGRLRISAYNEDDISLTYCFEIDSFIYTSATEKSITGTVLILNGNEVKNEYKNVSFVYSEE